VIWQISDTGQLCVIFLLYKYITFFLNCKGKRRERGNRSSLIKAYIVIDASIHPNGTNVDETLLRLYVLARASLSSDITY